MFMFILTTCVDYKAYNFIEKKWEMETLSFPEAKIISSGELTWMQLNYTDLNTLVGSL